jgi:hypothetical protein
MGHGAVSGSATSSLVVVARVVSSLTKITATVIVKKKKKKEITATVVVLSSECVVARPSMKLKNSLTDRPSTAEENAIGIDLAFVHRSMPWPNPCESAREIPEISEGFNRGAYLYLYQLFNLPSAAYRIEEKSTHTLTHSHTIRFVYDSDPTKLIHAACVMDGSNNLSYKHRTKSMVPIASFSLLSISVSSALYCSYRH